MPKFSVTAIFTGSKYLGEFEADSEKEAKEMALASEHNHASLCHQCSDEIELDEHSANEAVAYKVED